MFYIKYNKYFQKNKWRYWLNKIEIRINEKDQILTVKNTTVKEHK